MGNGLSMKPFVLEIQIPDRLQQLISKDRALSGALDSAIADFSVWLSDNKTTFFFDYTDHGIAHVNNVLRSVEMLVPESTWDMLSADDGVAMVAAVLLHDCAMHLSADGFFELLADKYPEVTSEVFVVDASWREEFVRFEQEAGRWDAEKLMSVFGDAETADLLKDSATLSDRQRLLVGEFLRRNHARLAHEIALNGVPGVGLENRFHPFGKFKKEHRDLYGFLARSHNMPIRDASDVLPKLRRRRYMEVHAPYVMALLRIADYIQIDAARAPTQILQLRGLKSPVSRSEWAKHYAVLELNRLGDDPEALVVIADPKSVQIYVGLKALFRDLQRELDESWALLGEVYGPVVDLRALALSVRRLHSNLDDVKEFERQSRPSYVPREVRLTTSSAELLHLLVGPLYGNKPVVGVRELIQNAVDAVNERGNFYDVHGAPAGSPYKPLIEVELDNSPSSKSFRITDNGVGMPLETIEQYFLKAGASFRQSKWWRSEFVDDDGNARVRRSGRFGVGVLAAFLIGQKVIVTTRHFLDASGLGYRFELMLDNGLVEISRVECEVGTNITIPINSNETIESLVRGKNEELEFADWFVYPFPKINYRLRDDAKWLDVEPKTIVQVPLVAENSDWTQVDAERFEGVYWSYSHKRSKLSGYTPGHYLACNGIFVADSTGYRSGLPPLSIAGKDGWIQIRHPTLLVDDKNGRLPLTVQRTGIADGRYPFQDALEASIAEELSRRLFLALSIPAQSANCAAALKRVNSVAHEFGSIQRGGVGLSALGWTPLDPGVLLTTLPSVALIEFGSQTGYDGLINRLDIDRWPELMRVPVVSEGGGGGYIVRFVRSMIQGSQWGRENPFDAYLKAIVGLRVFVSENAYKALNKKTGLPQYLWRTLRLVESHHGWRVYESGSPPASVESAENLIELAHSTESQVFCVAYFDAQRLSAEEVKKPVPSKFSEAWLTISPSGFVQGDAPVGPEAVEAWDAMDSAEEEVSE